jgi:hypothetical protein
MGWYPRIASRWPKAIMIFGGLLLLTGIASAYLKIETELKFTDLTSGNPNWVRPAPTSFDVFILGFPVSGVIVAGATFMIVGYALFKWAKPPRKSRNDGAG